MRFLPHLSEEAQAWLRERGYTLPTFHAKGKSAGVWCVRKNRKKFAVKVEHAKSTRVGMVEKEVENLRAANKLGIGPKLVDSNSALKLILMEFVEGVPLGEWLQSPRTTASTKRVLRSIFAQAHTLDEGKLDHGQLAGKLHNILVGKSGKIWIIDFEKASLKRKPHNVNQLLSCFRNRGIQPADF